MEIDNNESNGGSNGTTENGLHLYPVSVNDSGEGLPYAPVDWPLPGDKWRWKVGRRIAASGYFLDRYVYLPKRFQEKRGGKGFASRLSLEQYVRTIPGADVKAFFASFSWRVPARNLSEMKGTENGDTMEHSESESQPGPACKVGNKTCGSLSESGEDPSSRVSYCDICCTEPGFCRDCCCILCGLTVSSAFGGYSFIKCEATLDDGLICGHIAHIECGLRSYMAGTVGGSIGLDAEYYCRRCDARTDLLPHVTKLFETCESSDSSNDFEKILNVGARVLHGSRRTDAKELLHNIELAMGKLKSRTYVEDDGKMEDNPAVTPGVLSNQGNDAFESAGYEEPVDITPDSPKSVAEIFNPHIESLKLEIKVDQILQALKKSQELEYNIAQERLHAQKNYIHNLYQQLDKEKRDLSQQTAYIADPDALFQLLASRVDQIKREVAKFKDMGQVAKGFGRTSEEIIKECFGLES